MELHRIRSGAHSALGFGPLERPWVVAAHASVLLGVVFPLGSIVGPLTIMLMKGFHSRRIEAQALEAVNLGITYCIAALVAVGIDMQRGEVTSIHDVGSVGTCVSLVFGFMAYWAARMAHQGKVYRYPFTLRLVHHAPELHPRAAQRAASPVH